MTCAKCCAEKPATEFHRTNTRPSGRHSICGACHSAYNKSYRAVRIDKIRAQKRESAYGLTDTDHRAMLLAQGGKCAICLTDITKRPNTDHDHTTGTVRGLLCIRCNLLLGKAHDDEAILLAAIQYLRRARSSVA